MRSRLFAMGLLITGVMLLPAMSRSQSPFGKGGKGFSMDPDEIFSKYSNGKEVIVMSELDPQTAERLKRMAGFMGITVGEKVTRDEFKKHASGAMSLIQSGAFQFKGMGGGGAPPADVAAPNGGGTTTPPTGMGEPRGGQKGPGDREAVLDAIFRKMDKNNDGTLSADEVPENMQREREKYDKNGDGFIDLMEFKTFANEVRPPKEPEPMRGDSGKQRTDTPDQKKPEAPVEEVKSTIYRVGKLPKDLPEWFIRLDKAGDVDGQVGLWEARNEKSVLDEFNKYDLNGDGLITAEEYLRYKGALKRVAEGNSASSSSTSADREKDREKDKEGDKDRDRRGPPSFGSGGPPSFNGPPSSSSSSQPPVSSGGNYAAPSPGPGSGFRGFGGQSGSSPSGDTNGPTSIGSSKSGEVKMPSFGRLPDGSGTQGGGFRGFGKGGNTPRPQ